MFTCSVSRKYSYSCGIMLAATRSMWPTDVAYELQVFFSFDQRRLDLLALTAIASALFWPTITKRP